MSINQDSSSPLRGGVDEGASGDGTGNLTAGQVGRDGELIIPVVPVDTSNNAAKTAEHRHGADLSICCNQCGTSWQYAPDVPQQCPDCIDHLGELINPEHPDSCMKDCGCAKPAGHDGACHLVGPLPEPGCRCRACMTCS